MLLPLHELWKSIFWAEVLSISLKKKLSVGQLFMSLGLIYKCKWRNVSTAYKECGDIVNLFKDCVRKFFIFQALNSICNGDYLHLLHWSCSVWLIKLNKLACLNSLTYIHTHIAFNNTFISHNLIWGPVFGKQSDNH